MNSPANPRDDKQRNDQRRSGGGRDAGSRGSRGGARNGSNSGGSSRSAATSATTDDEIEHIPGPVEVAWITHVSASTELFDKLVSRHRERQRRYHRIEHVEAVLAHIGELSTHEAIDDLGVLVAAALYHDAIYESQHPNNERASARLARRDLAALEWDEHRTDRVGQLIEGTQTHLDPDGTDAAVLFDADLAILGSTPEIYGKYVAAVRDEYGHLDDREWSEGREQVMSAFLERDAIYATATGRERWEQAARANITTELSTLRH